MVLMDKKFRILEAATHVFARHGLEKGKIADVAKKAGIGKGTIYEYFRSKEDIFKAIETLFFSEVANAFESIKSGSLSPTEKIKHIISWTLNMSTDRKETVLIITELWAQASRGHYHGSTVSQLFNFYKTYKKEIESILDEGVQSREFREMNTEGVATMLLAFLDGMALQIAFMKNHDVFTNIKNEAMDSFLRGILK